MPVDELQPNGYNPNRMSDGQLAALANTIRQDGFLGVILANETADGLVIIDGEHRWRAAKQLGMESVPCFLVRLPERQAKALTIKLNQISGSWDGEELLNLLRDLPDPLDDLGFSDYEFRKQLEVLRDDDSARRLCEEMERQSLAARTCGISTDERYVGFVLSEEQRALLDRALAVATEKEEDATVARSAALERIIREYLQNHAAVPREASRVERGTDG